MDGMDEIFLITGVLIDFNGPRNMSHVMHKMLSCIRNKALDLPWSRAERRWKGKSFVSAPSH